MRIRRMVVAWRRAIRIWRNPTARRMLRQALADHDPERPGVPLDVLLGDACTCSNREVDGRTGEQIHAAACPRCPQTSEQRHGTDAMGVVGGDG